MDALTFSQIVFNTLASLVILLFGVVLGVHLYYLVRVAAWVRKIEQNISQSSEKVKNFFTIASEALMVPIITRFFTRVKKRKKR